MSKMTSSEALRGLRTLSRCAGPTPKRIAVGRNLTVDGKRVICTNCTRSSRQARHAPGHAPARPSNVAHVPNRVSFAPVGCRGYAQAAREYATEDPERTHGPMAEYDARVESGRLRDDEHQRNIIRNLQDLHDMLQSYEQPPVQQPTIESLQPPKKSFFSFLSSSSPAGSALPPIPESLPKGMYMFGDVGSGKTMMMDLFYDTLPPNIKRKTRIHFHAFMQSVHKDLHKMKMQHGNDIDSIPFVAAGIAERSSVLCFDEFQCTDVADAMILRRLMESLMAHGTVIVTTSNRHPDDLYKNGIQRESFIPCINLLKSRLTVLNLDSSTDYRKIPRPPSGVYHHPLDASAQTHVERWFRFLGDFDNDPPHPAVHEVWGREVRVPKASGKCACLVSTTSLDALREQPTIWNLRGSMRRLSLQGCLG